MDVIFNGDFNDYSVGMNILSVITQERRLYSVSCVKCNGTENVIKLISHSLTQNSRVADDCIIFCVRLI